MVVSAFAASESDDLNLIVDTGTTCIQSAFIEGVNTKVVVMKLGLLLMRQSLLFGLAKARLKLSQSNH